ncbi:MAG: hypothetical protein ABI697_12195 [Devosia sp.]
MAESTSIKLEDGLKARVHALAEREDRTANKVMNEAIADYVARRERRLAYLAEVEARHRDMRDAGVHITEKQADEWIESLLRGENPPLPRS